MGKISGIFNQSLNGIYTIRGFADYKEIIRLSEPHKAYQRPVIPTHIEEIRRFIESGKDSFSPEIILSYTLKYDYNKKGTPPTNDPITDLLNGVGFKSNVDGFSFKTGRKLESGVVCDITTPNKSFSASELKPFRRVDGNHRLNAIEESMMLGRELPSGYIIPFCLILLPDDEAIKKEKIIFHNINSKAIPLKSEQLLKSLVEVNGISLDFSDNELENDFGDNFLLLRKIIIDRPLIINNISKLEWASGYERTILLGLIEYVSKKIEEPISTNPVSLDCFVYSIQQAFENINGTYLQSSELYALTYLFYIKNIASESESKALQTHINNFVTWRKLNNIHMPEKNENVDAILTKADYLLRIFEEYLHNKKFYIFLSRWFDGSVDENERAIQRVIEKINSEKNIKVTLNRVDRHNEGFSRDIFQRIDDGIKNCGILIADLTGGKANVHHEIGMAMGMGKPLILIHHGTDEEADKNTPSNLRMYEQIRFSANNYAYLEQQLKIRLLDFYSFN